MGKIGSAGCLNLSTLICSGECHFVTALYGQLLLYSEHYTAGFSKRFSIEEHIESFFIPRETRTHGNVYRPGSQGVNCRARGYIQCC